MKEFITADGKLELHEVNGLIVIYAGRLHHAVKPELLSLSIIDEQCFLSLDSVSFDISLEELRQIQAIFDFDVDD